MGAGGYLSDQCQSVPSVRALFVNQPDGGKYNGIFARRFDRIFDSHGTGKDHQDCLCADFW